MHWIGDVKHILNICKHASSSYNLLGVTFLTCEFQAPNKNMTVNLLILLFYSCQVGRMPAWWKCHNTSHSCILSLPSLLTLSSPSPSGAWVQVRGQHARQRSARPRAAHPALPVPLRGVQSREPPDHEPNPRHAHPHHALHEPRRLRSGCQTGNEATNFQMMKAKCEIEKVWLKIT